MVSEELVSERGHPAQAGGRDDVRCDLPAGPSRWGLCAIGALLVAKVRRSAALVGKLVRMGRSLNLGCRSLQDAPSLLRSPTTRPVPARPVSLYLGTGQPIVSQPGLSFCSAFHDHQPRTPASLSAMERTSRRLGRVPSGCGNFGVGSPRTKIPCASQQGSSLKRLALAQQLSLCESKSSRSAIKGSSRDRLS